MRIAEIQKEHAVWQARNFPNAQPWECILGILEELGELEDALYAHDTKGVRDAMGDIMIFTLGFCSLSGLDIETDCLDRFWGVEVSARTPFSAAGKLAHAYLKQHQGIHTREDHPRIIRKSIVGIVNALDRYCRYIGPDLVGVLEETWAAVKQRDWRGAL